MAAYSALEDDPRETAAEVFCAMVAAANRAGMALVPREPTAAMLDAGRGLQSLGDETLDRDDMAAKWKAMLKAAG